MDYMEIPKLRLDRAVKHLNEFWQETDKFLRTNPVGTDTERYVDNGKDCLRLIFRVYQEPPKTLGVIAGDCIHNLRAILDNIVWSLGQAYPPTDSTARVDKLYFPIYKSEKAFQDGLNKPELKAIKNFPSVGQALIEKMQPYNSSRQAHLLSVLHDLWNADKHRSPNLMVAANGGVSVKGYNLQQPGGLSAGLIMQDGIIFGYGTIPEGGIAPDAKIELLNNEVCFNESGPAGRYVARVFLYELLQFVNEVMTKFKPIFPK